MGCITLDDGFCMTLTRGTVPGCGLLHVIDKEHPQDTGSRNKSTLIVERTSGAQDTCFFLYEAQLHQLHVGGSSKIAMMRMQQNDLYGFASIWQGVPLGISSDFDGFVPILQRITLRKSLFFYGFALILQGVPFRISSDFDGFVYIWQGVPLRISLIYSWICIYFARVAPCNFIGF